MHLNLKLERATVNVYRVASALQMQMFASTTSPDCHAHLHLLQLTAKL